MFICLLFSGCHIFSPYLFGSLLKSSIPYEVTHLSLKKKKGGGSILLIPLIELGLNSNFFPCLFIYTSPPPSVLFPVPAPSSSYSFFIFNFSQILKYASWVQDAQCRCSLEPSTALCGPSIVWTDSSSVTHSAYWSKANFSTCSTSADYNSLFGQ